MVRDKTAKHLKFLMARTTVLFVIVKTESDMGDGTYTYK